MLQGRDYLNKRLLENVVLPVPSLTLPTTYIDILGNENRETAETVFIKSSSNVRSEAVPHKQSPIGRN